MAPKKKLNRREALDIERALELSKNDEFLAYLNELRMLADIPEDLSPDSDVWKHEVFVSAGNEEDKEGWVEMNNSYFLDRNTEPKIREAVDAVLQAMLRRYGLPFYFEDWLRRGLLYKTFPEPPHDDGWFMRRSQGPKAPPLYPLDSAEKKFHATIFRIRNGLPLRGRVPKKHQKEYREFLRSLNQPEFKGRRSRVYADSLKLIESLKGTFTEVLESGEKLELRKKYTDVVGELYPDKNFENSSTEKEDQRRATRLRQRKHRLEKRSKGFLQ